MKASSESSPLRESHVLLKCKCRPFYTPVLKAISGCWTASDSVWVRTQNSCAIASELLLGSPENIWTRKFGEHRTHFRRHSCRVFEERWYAWYFFQARLSVHQTTSVNQTDLSACELYFHVCVQNWICQKSKSVNLIKQKLLFIQCNTLRNFFNLCLLLRSGQEDVINKPITRMRKQEVFTKSAEATCLQKRSTRTANDPSKQNNNNMKERKKNSKIGHALIYYFCSWIQTVHKRSTFAKLSCEERNMLTCCWVLWHWKKDHK